jgi:predicted acyl esterase
VYAVGGWADGYPNAIPRLLAGLSGPRKGLIGPWAHTYPEKGSPGPAIGFLQESLRWWDYWLKGIDTGIMDEPMLRSWLQESQPPRTHYTERPGRWVADPGWPSPHLKMQTFALNAGVTAGQLDGVLEAEAAPSQALTLKGSQTNGLDTGSWTTYALPGEFPADQQADNGRCLVFTSAPADAPVDILGFPEARLTLAADQPLALVSVRLSDVAPDGASTLVSWGVLNLTHGDSHEVPTPLAPGQVVTVTVPLKLVGYTLPAGHRWRVAVSPTHWPMVWPSPRPVTLTLFSGQSSRLILPIRSPQPEDAQLPLFEPAEGSPPLPVEVIRTSKMQRHKRVDVVTGLTELQVVFDFGRVRYSDNGLEYDDMTLNTYTITEGAPLSAAVRCEQFLEYHRGDWQVRLETSSTMTADATNFHVTNLLDAYEGTTRVFTKSWTCRVPRDLV